MFAANLVPDGKAMLAVSLVRGCYHEVSPLRTWKLTETFPFAPNETI